jgi:hypothetical protein
MLDTLRRMFEGSRPIDRVMLVIELLVLVLIAWEVGVGILERCEAKKRRKIVEQRRNEMRDAMVEGQRLLQTVPKLMEPIAKWASDVDAWERETQELLRSYSAQAETAFLIDTSFVPSTIGAIPDPRRYGKLMMRLQNLRAIIEKPEVYF